MHLASIPPTISKLFILVFTTELAATTAPFSIITPLGMTAPVAIHTSSSI